MLVTSTLKLFSFIYLSLVFQSNIGCINDGLPVYNLIISVVFCGQLPWPTFCFLHLIHNHGLNCLNCCLHNGLFNCFYICHFCFCLFYYTLKTWIYLLTFYFWHHIMLCNLYEIVLMDEYTCFFVAYALICIIIKRINISSHLHTIRYIAHTHLHYGLGLNRYVHTILMGYYYSWGHEQSYAASNK